MEKLHPVDACILLSYIASVVAIGAFLGRGKQDAKGYLLGGKDAPWWAILGSIVATETSTVTFLSVPGISFAEGGDLRFLQLPIGYMVGRLIVVLWLLPLYFRGELFTVYELLQTRFGT
ncbi:MAG: transporter, partial [Planctomycetales bacterium]|nr:transporter [Planctomycetales bacterium]